MMVTESSPQALLTMEEVRAWIAERHDIRVRLEELERKIEGFRLLFPDLADAMVGPPERSAEPRGSTPKIATKAKLHLPLHERPMSDVVLFLLKDEQGGRPPRWFREKCLQTPGLRERVERSDTLIGNTLLRHAKYGKLKKVRDRYYLPDVLKRIESGEIEELEDEKGEDSFNSIMHEAMREYGKPFKAADAIMVAQQLPSLSDRLKEQPSRVYSWLSREVHKQKLRRDGHYYSYPPQGDEALNGNAASASSAGEVAASPIENRQGFRLVS